MVQDAIDTEFRRYEQAPFIPEGVRVVVESHTGGSTFEAMHGLGRRPQGWFVLYARAAAGTIGNMSIYYRELDRWDDQRIELFSSGSFQRLELWVF